MWNRLSLGTTVWWKVHKNRRNRWSSEGKQLRSICFCLQDRLAEGVSWWYTLLCHDSVSEEEAA